MLVCSPITLILVVFANHLAVSAVKDKQEVEDSDTANLAVDTVIQYFSGFVRALEDKYDIEGVGKDPRANDFLMELLHRSNDLSWTFINEVRSAIRDKMMRRMLHSGAQIDLRPFCLSAKQLKEICNALRIEYMTDATKWKVGSEKIFAVLCQYWAAGRASEVGLSQLKRAYWDDGYHCLYVCWNEIKVTEQKMMCFYPSYEGFDDCFYFNLFFYFVSGNSNKE